MTVLFQSLTPLNVYSVHLKEEEIQESKILGNFPKFMGLISEW
jgi:hypothetical protein